MVNRNSKKTVLLADDSEHVRSFIRAILEGAGYRVIEAVDGRDAVEIFSCNHAEIDILVLDVRMPRKNGKDAYNEMSRIKPGIKALFVSGYTGDVLPDTGFLAKPFKAEALLSHMAGMLN